MFPWDRALVAASAALFLALLSTPPASAAPARPVEVWAACGASSPAEKVVRVFPRPASNGGPPAGTSALLCGDANNGYRHLSDGHGADWQALAVYTGENWRDMADFAITQILAAPQPGYPQFVAKNNSWRYKAPVEIKDGQDQVHDMYWPVVAIAAQDGKILTAYPTRNLR